MTIVLVIEQDNEQVEDTDPSMAVTVTKDNEDGTGGENNC